jgi:hypothetical protein
MICPHNSFVSIENKAFYNLTLSRKENRMNNTGGERRGSCAPVIAVEQIKHLKEGQTRLTRSWWSRIGSRARSRITEKLQNFLDIVFL